MRNLIFALGLVVIPLTTVNAFDISLLRNNKESQSKVLDSFAREHTNAWLKNLSLSAGEVKELAQSALQSSLDAFDARKAQCDLGLVSLIKHEAASRNLIKTHADHLNFLTYLRLNDFIDDIFYKIQKDGASVLNDLNFVDAKNPSRPLSALLHNKTDLDLKKLYAEINTRPDDVTNCIFGSYNRLAKALTWKKTRDRDRQLKRLNYLAYEKDIIDAVTLNKLSVLRKHEVLDWPIYTKSYLDIISNAKDKLAGPTKETVSQNDWHLTRRGKLYRVYTSTQIIMLADVVQKAAKRMEARQVALNFKFKDTTEADENYVLSPMEQYRLSIRMLKKDMGEIARSDLFRGAPLEYEDFIAAAYETGLVKSDELNYVLKFEEFWNPKIPKWKSYAAFVFSLAGTATFYLPPPWNILGAIGLVVTQTKVLKDKNKVNPEDNWNTIL